MPYRMTFVGVASRLFIQPNQSRLESIVINSGTKVSSSRRPWGISLNFGVEGFNRCPLDRGPNQGTGALARNK